MKYDLVTPVVERTGYPDLLYVEVSSDDNLKQALAAMARHFKKEFKYDRLQYDEFDQDEACVGVIILDRASDITKHEDHYPNYVIGGGCFRMNDANSYFLDWIWLHPFARNRGKLKKVWPRFKARFGSFELTTPVSPQMKAFLERHSSQIDCLEPGSTLVNWSSSVR